MAYSTYNVYAEMIPSIGYGTSMKNYVEALVAAVPCLSFDSIISDTTSSYEAYLNISLANGMKLHYKSSSSYVITTEVVLATNNSSITSLGLSTQGGVYMHWVEATDMLFYLTGTSGLYVGELTSLADSSRIGAVGTGTTYYTIFNGTKYTASISAYSPGSAYASSLSPNQYCVTEGFYVPGYNSLTAIPYTLTGSGPCSMIGPNSISNGTLFRGDTFSLVRINGSCCWKI